MSISDMGVLARVVIGSRSTRFIGDELVKNEAISSPNPVRVSGADTLDPLYFGSVIHKDRMIINYIWLVVWNIFYFSIYWE